MLKKILFWLVTFILGLGLLALAVFAYINSNSGRTFISGKLSTILQMPVEIQGAIGPGEEFSGLRIEQLSLYQSEARFEYLSVDDLTVNLPWWQWLSGERIEWQGRIKQAQINLPTGTGDSVVKDRAFEFPAVDASLKVARLTVIDDGLTVADLQRFELQTIADSMLEMSASGGLLNRPFTFQARLEKQAPGKAYVSSSIKYRGLEVGLSGLIDDLQTLHTNGLTLSARSDKSRPNMQMKALGELTGTLSNWQLGVDELSLLTPHGQLTTSLIAELQNGNDLIFSSGIANLTAIDAKQFLGQFDVASQLQGSLNASLKFYGSRDELQLENLQISVGEANLKLSASGTAKLSMSTLVELDSQLEFENPAAVLVSKTSVWGAEGQGTASAKISIENQLISLKNLNANISQNDLALSVNGDIGDLTNLHDSQLEISTAGFHNDSPVGGNASSAPPWHLSIFAPKGLKKSVSVNGKIMLVIGALDIFGKAENLSELKGIDLQFEYLPQMSVADSPFSFNLAAAIVPEKMTGTFVAKDFYTQGFEITARQIDGPGLIQFTGNVDADKATSGGGKITLKAADPNLFARQAGVDIEFPALTDFEADIQYSDMGLNLSNLTFATGETKIVGNIQFEKRAGATDFLQLELNSPRINIVDLGFTSKQEDQYFSQDSLNLRMFNHFDLDLKVRADTVLSPALIYQNLVLEARSQQGQLQIEAVQSLQGGGNSLVVIDVDSRPELPRVSVVTKVHNINPGELRALVGESDQYSGDVDIELQVSGEGDSVKDILSSADGYFLLRVNKATLADRKLHLLSADFILGVMRLLNPFNDNDKQIQVDCGLAAFHIHNGIAKAANTIVLSGEKLFLQGGGKINFANEKVMLDLKPKSNQGIGIGTSTLINSISVVGTLSDPNIKTSTKNLLKSGASIGAAVASGGMSLFFQGVFNRITSGDKECQKAEKQFWEIDKNSLFAKPEAIAE
ncbi:MAG: hypothetical protein ACI8P9_004014 [Parasphingorhabdus sp.]|jgi:hypothetical protein